ncbi:type IV pilus inner membrane component PilO [Flocculibacter collagenilyticus]|uniref:type 4a pilus biogenesis protein PilO n=1 Tax=Flocculibacter collagenilyticus TaxID=2744479 RepID=UPI0018F75BF0|nr:type 4a pilus biogenesis protein PilO [Flocculibacter collagenilyticus]
MNLNVDFSDIDLSELDLENIGSWPPVIKVIFGIIVAVGVAFGSYSLLVSGKIEDYERALAKEEELRQTYKIKYAASANLELYKQQMQDMEKQLSTLLKRLPATHETPGLLDDITYVGTTSGLSFVKINWMTEVEKEFYTELPIKIEVVGEYHEFGEFVSKVAALPRIVSLHDFEIVDAGNDKLRLNVVAKTYRYKETES